MQGVERIFSLGVAEKALFPFKSFLKLSMGGGRFKSHKFAGQYTVGEERKKGLQAHNFEQFRAILRCRFPHGVFSLVSQVLNEEGSNPQAPPCGYATVRVCPLQRLIF